MVGDDRVNNETAAASLAENIQVAQSECADRTAPGEHQANGNKPHILIPFPDVIMRDYCIPV